MDSVEAIRQEGEAMHHCVFTNEYYLNQETNICFGCLYIEM
ncbi:PcfJ domain-containing protein [Bacteroides xylanisolvens]|nr:PcfJ domain-containing protein [Bacteroides xylanisolvens]MDB0738144.1 PcfJ domain-containing protein [Bacteroides xylanisolvens]